MQKYEADIEAIYDDALYNEGVEPVAEPEPVAEAEPEPKTEEPAAAAEPEAKTEEPEEASDL